MHIDLTADIPTPAGEMFVIEMSGIGTEYSWRGTCGEIALPQCPTADADQYMPGVTNAGPTIGDFGFRTYDPGDSDLDGMPDGYEMVHACLNKAMSDATGNPDGDGANSGAEHGAGSDPCIANPDSDGDGCTDFEESGPAPAFGGMRNPALASDFYDVNGTRKVDGADIGLARARYNPSVPTAPEDAIYDRMPGAAPWAPGPPDDVINAVDIGLVRFSFNHSCTGAP